MINKKRAYPIICHLFVQTQQAQQPPSGYFPNPGGFPGTQVDLGLLQLVSSMPRALSLPELPDEPTIAQEDHFRAEFRSAAQNAFPAVQSSTQFDFVPLKIVNTDNKKTEWKGESLQAVAIEIGVRGLRAGEEPFESEVHFPDGSSLKACYYLNIELV